MASLPEDEKEAGEEEEEEAAAAAEKTLGEAVGPQGEASAGAGAHLRQAQVGTGAGITEYMYFFPPFADATSLPDRIPVPTLCLKRRRLCAALPSACGVVMLRCGRAKDGQKGCACVRARANAKVPARDYHDEA